MKKIVLFIAIALAGCQTFAQSGGWLCEAALSFGFYDRSGLGRSSEIVDVSSASATNEGLRSEYRPTVLPTFLFTCGYKIPGSFVGLFLDTAWSYAFNNLEGGPSLLSENEHILHVMPELRLYYSDNGRTRLYATLGAGARYRRFSETYEGSTLSNSDVGFTYQLSPFGMSFGEKWYFSCDFGMGYAWSFFRIGAGYKF